VLVLLMLMLMLTQVLVRMNRVFAVGLGVRTPSWMMAKVETVSRFVVEVVWVGAMRWQEQLLQQLEHFSGPNPFGLM